MIIYPAIDLREKKCVRLYQGDFKRPTIYGSDPFAIADQFISNGASWLHIIDLDGAKNPQQLQTALISQMIKNFKIKVQTGGGIRTKAQIEALLNAGAERVILGSQAVANKKEVGEWFNYFGADKLVLALDVMINENNIPMVVMHGWQATSTFSLFNMIEEYQVFGLTHLLCTNISLDGTMKGPDFNLYASILKKFPLIKLQASGGIHSIADVMTLRKKQINGAIIGRALYEKKFTLVEVLSC